MNIKEIALKVADSLRNKIDGISHMQSNQGLVRFAEALISAYKAELLKEVGEPVAYYDPDLDCGSAGISFDPLSDGIGLYTPDQVAAAILKATGLLEGKIERLKRQSANRLIGLCKGGEDNDELRTQLVAAQEEIQRMKRERLLTADAIESMHASHKDQLAKAEQRVVRQYYFKNNSCKAESANDPDCICWHDEGTGPMQPLLDGTYLVQMTWRKFVKEM